MSNRLRPLPCSLDGEGACSSQIAQIARRLQSCSASCVIGSAALGVIGLLAFGERGQADSIDHRKRKYDRVRVGMRSRP